MFKSRFTPLFNLVNFLYFFCSFQVFSVVLFLLNKSNKYKVDFDVYLNYVKYTTIILLAYLIIYLILNLKNFTDKIDFFTIFSTSLILTLYFTMIIHTDIQAIFSPTIFLMLLVFFIFTKKEINYNNLLKLISYITISNSVFVFLQIFNLIPIAQENVRESVFDIGNRPTGIFFNAFAMGYAMSICFIIFSWEILKKNYKSVYFLGLLLTFISLLLSGTRTSLLLSLILIALMSIFKFIRQDKFSLKISYLASFLVLMTPIFLIGIGKILNLESLRGLNGRTQLWSCVLNKWESFLPFGVGVQAAFPQGFCSDDEWFSKLRHPENMFLLTYVEAGILGILTLIAFFIAAFYISSKSFKKGNYLPWAISNIYLLSCLFYVPLFHYVPFLPNRTADRGVFNFLLVTLIWLIILRTSNYNNDKTSRPVNNYRK